MLSRVCILSLETKVNPWIITILIQTCDIRARRHERLLYGRTSAFNRCCQQVTDAKHVVELAQSRRFTSIPGAHTQLTSPLTQASSFLITVILTFFSGVVSIVQDRAISANRTESQKILVNTWDNDFLLPQVITDHIIGCGSQLEPCQCSF